GPSQVNCREQRADGPADEEARMTKEPAKRRPSKLSVRELILTAGGVPKPGRRRGGDGPRSSPDDDVYPSPRNLHEQYWNLATRQSAHPDEPAASHPGFPPYFPQEPHQQRWRIVEMAVRLKGMLQLEMERLEADLREGKVPADLNAEVEKLIGDVEGLLGRSRSGGQSIVSLALGDDSNPPVFFA